MSARETVILAGGCFWGLQHLLRQLPGVTETRVGYSGGTFANPTYPDVCTGTTGHAESVHVTFDPARLPFRRLLMHFFQMHDPTTVDRQGNDRGPQYRSAIFYSDADQKKTAEEVIARIDASGRWPGRVVTELAPAGAFYDAEEMHQDYLMKAPHGYSCHFVRPDWTLDEAGEEEGAA